MSRSSTHLSQTNTNSISTRAASSASSSLIVASGLSPQERTTFSMPGDPPTEPPSSNPTRPPQCCLWISQMMTNTSSPGPETRRPQFMKSNISEKSDKEQRVIVMGLMTL